MFYWYASCLLHWCNLLWSLVFSQGDDVCALENEISRTARLIAVEGGPGYPDIFTGGRDRRKKREPYDDEDFSVPLALMTVGWDPSGDPTHNWHGSGRDETCAIRLLNSQRVTVWFTSHTQLRSHPHPKVKFTARTGLGAPPTAVGWERRRAVTTATIDVVLVFVCLNS